ncbi:chromosome condensation protein CrcB [Rhodopirellula bahusiensis]|uniref:Fluoride-specific ion channel FluC n=2 Tax=Rhodopirellula bahusiensis TaxID=2014065 RepID=A0A2G1W0U2_9BACT|nr:chromosome condensation protein CrcB [Rhodopirellula bahusiensis]
MGFEKSRNGPCSDREKLPKLGPSNVNSSALTGNGENAELTPMTFVSDLFAIALGGSIGAVVRYVIALAVVSAPLSGWLTLHGCVGTTLANLLGCFALGGLFQFSQALVASEWGATGWAASLAHPRMLLAVRIGFLGSLTTFSTLIGETAVFASQGRILASSLLLGINVIAGWCLFWAAAAVVRNWTS